MKSELMLQFNPLGLIPVLLLLIQPATGQDQYGGKTQHGYEAPDGVNFPFFRGKGGRGIAGGSGYPLSWNGSEGKNIKWKILIPLKGKSSPVIWKDKLFITGAGKGEFMIYCIDKGTGRMNWESSGKDFPGASVAEPETDAEAGMAVPTQAVNENVVCSLFGNGNLVCHDHNGKFLWGSNIGIPVSIYGYTSSLLIHKNILIVQFDSENKLSLAGYDIQTGKKAWETERKGKMVNSSPVLAFFDSRMQVIVNGNPDVTAFDPLSGEELWSQPGVSGDVAPSLAVNSKLVFTTTDYFNLMAIKPGKNGGTVWKDNTYTPDVSSPVAGEDLLYVSTGAGDIACYSTENGEIVWTYYAGSSFYASPVLCDGKVWFLDRKGVMHIIAVDRTFNKIGESGCGEHTDCTPVFSEGKIYIRGNDHLFCISE